MLPLDREVVRRRFGNRCGYCGTAEHEAGAKLTIDHYQPLSQGGTDDPLNLIYCCFACNGFKANYWSADTVEQLLHPLYDDPTAHYVERVDHELIPLTDRGRFHITQLHLNRPELIESRRRRAYEATEDTRYLVMQARLQAVEAELRRLTQGLFRLTGGINVNEEDTS